MDEEKCGFRADKPGALAKGKLFTGSSCWKLLNAKELDENGWCFSRFGNIVWLVDDCEESSPRGNGYACPAAICC
ncbi:hypothetical protein F2Q68_00032467 [Brassica cretica]|uniref:Uncharacterized protein n=1 Tax=Brassica cretica TaxID=69181 RepID=A0A8S9G8E0_BRACR|nr:hypothetical protein F2Q68_00032467 [Brassica cretica]